MTGKTDEQLGRKIRQTMDLHNNVTKEKGKMNRTVALFMGIIALVVLTGIAMYMAGLM